MIETALISSAATIIVGLFVLWAALKKNSSMLIDSETKKMIANNEAAAKFAELNLQLREQVMEELTTLSSSYDDLQVNHAYLLEELRNYENKVLEYEKHIEGLEKKIESYLSQISCLESKLEEYQKLVKDYKADKEKAEEEVSSLKKRVKSLEQELEQYKDEYNKGKAKKN